MPWMYLGALGVVCSGLAGSIGDFTSRFMLTLGFVVYNVRARKKSHC